MNLQIEDVVTVDKIREKRDEFAAQLEQGNQQLNALIQQTNQLREQLLAISGAVQACNILIDAGSEPAHAKVTNIADARN